MLVLALPAQVRHGIMLVGPSGSGKTAIMECLAAALTELGTKTVLWRMNPKVGEPGSGRSTVCGLHLSSCTSLCLAAVREKLCSWSLSALRMHGSHGEQLGAGCPAWL